MPRSIGREWCGILLLLTAFNFGVRAVTKEAPPRAPVSGQQSGRRLIEASLRFNFDIPTSRSGYD
jgi:hypothetical protein